MSEATRLKERDNTEIILNMDTILLIDICFLVGTGDLTRGSVFCISRTSVKTRAKTREPKLVIPGCRESPTEDCASNTHYANPAMEGRGQSELDRILFRAEDHIIIIILF